MECEILLYVCIAHFENRTELDMVIKKKVVYVGSNYNGGTMESRMEHDVSVPFQFCVCSIFSSSFLGQLFLTS